MIAARSLYAETDRPLQTPRRLEYELLARCTKALSEASAQKTNGYPALIKALEENQRMWSTLAADVAEDGNGLPAKLRAQLFYLYEFTAQHSKAVRESRASVEVLVDINTAVMRGLRGEGGVA